MEGCTHGAPFQAPQVSDSISLVNIPCVFLGRDLAACVLCRGVDRGCGGSSGLQSESPPSPSFQPSTSSLVSPSASLSRFCWVNWLSPRYSPQENSFFPGLDHLPLPYFLSFSKKKKKKVFFQLISPLILTLFFRICAFFLFPYHHFSVFHKREGDNLIWSIDHLCLSSLRTESLKIVLEIF